MLYCLIELRETLRAIMDYFFPHLKKYNFVCKTSANYEKHKNGVEYDAENIWDREEYMFLHKTEE